MNEWSFFSYERISDRLIIVTENMSMVHRFTIGVVVGDRKILVIDAGLGMTKGLRSLVEKLAGSDKPILCACTHGHPDHIGSAKQFDEAYLSSRDYPMLESFSLNTERRFSDLDAWSLGNLEMIEYCKEHFLDNTGTVFKDLADGDIFDLGGATIEVIELPGHSMGCMAFYNRAERYAFTGDAIDTEIHLENLDRQGFIAYQKSLLRFVERVGEDTVLYPAQHHIPLTAKIAHTLANICQEIASGEIDQDPPGEPIMKAIGNNPMNRAHFSGNVCVAYKKNRVMESDEKGKQHDQ